jgi:DNA-binding NtrC family response regulator
MGKILIIDDDKASCRTLQLHLRAGGHQVAIAHSVETGLVAASADPPELLILDIRMPGQSGLEGLPRFKQNDPNLHVIMITAFHDMESTIEAMQKGADDYIHKPVDIDELDAAIEKSLGSAREAEGLNIADSTQGNPLRMVGRSRAMKEIFKAIGMVARSPATVLITGESGTGKELVAQAIHRAGGSPDRPFVVVNCAAVVDTLLESDMFGHERGAFTGAVSRQTGKFALADNGTIFLDEVGEMSPLMQAKLLRVLQYKEFTPLGANQSQTTNARIIAATNKDLEAEVRAGRFREDLFYRLQVVNIHLPPLRERREDIVDLVQTLLGKINRELHREVSHIGQDVMGYLQAYDWPGNVRELENLLMKAVALSSSDSLSLDQLPVEITDRLVVQGDGTGTVESKDELLSLAEAEKRHVERVLLATGWHKGKACEVLDISRPRLRRMIRDYGLTPPPGLSVDPADTRDN